MISLATRRGWWLLALAASSAGATFAHAYYLPRLPRLTYLSGWTLFFLMLLLVILPVSATAERIKDLASIRGVRDNQLLGYGLVVGLDGSGDQTTQTPFTVQSIITSNSIRKNLIFEFMFNSLS